MKLISKENLMFPLFSLIGFGINPLPTFAILLFIGKLIKFKAMLKEIKHAAKSIWSDKKYRSFIIELTSLMAMAVFVSPNSIFSLKAFFSIMGMYFIGIVLLKMVYLNSKALTALFYGFFMGLLILSAIMFFEVRNVSGKLVFIFVPILYAAFHRRNEIFRDKKFAYLSFFIIFALIGVVLFKSSYGSATTKISYILSPIVFIFFYNFPIKMLKKFLIFSLFGVFLTIAAAVYFLDSQKVLSKFTNLPLSFKHRICILESSMDLIKKNPLDGNGLKSSRFYDSSEICYHITENDLIAHGLKKEAAEDLSKDFSFYKKPYYHQHNFIIQILFEFGIFGLIAFIIFLQRVIRDSDFSNKKNNAFNLTLIFAMFNSYIFAYSLWEFHIFISFAVAKLISKTR